MTAPWYIGGQPESITSHFLDASTDPQTLILRSLVALGGSVDEGELLALLENSFAIWIRVDQGGIGWDRSTLQNDCQALVSAGLLDIEPGGVLTVTELGRFAGESGLEVRSVTRVASLLRYAVSPLTEADLVVISQVTVELDAMYLPTAHKARNEQARWPQTLLNFGAQRGLINSLHVGGGIPLARCKKAAAVLCFVSSLPMARIEAEMMQHMRDSSAAGPIRSAAGRTRDVIDAVIHICRVRGMALAHEDSLDALGVRLEIGLPRELGSLAEQLGNLLTRANYLDLLTAGLSTAESVAKVADEQLVEILGKSTAGSLRASIAKYQEPPELE